MSRQLCLGSVLAVLTLSAPASAAPAWCTTEGATRIDAGTYELDNALKSADSRDALKALVGLTCYGGADVADQSSAIAAARGRWSKRLDMTEGDWADAAVWASAEQSERMQNIIYVDLQGQQLGIGDTLKRAWSSFGPFDQYAAISRGLGDNLSNDKHYVADAFGANLSEIGRLAYIEACLATTDATTVRWAMCEGDITALDRKKLATEVRADRTRTAFDRMAIRIRLDRMNQALAKHKQDVAAVAAKDPAYAKMFELAAATRTEWTTRWKTDADLVALTMAMDDARAKDSKKGFAGCKESTLKPLEAAVALLPGKQLAGASDEVENPFMTQVMAALVATPSGYLAGVAYYLCRSRDGDKADAITHALGDAMQQWPGHRGPRSATYTAILMAGLELDTSSDKIDYPALSRSIFQGHGSRGLRGAIGKLVVEGDTARIEFAKKSKQEQVCTDYRQTNRIVQITQDGRVIYEAFCLAYKSIPVDITPDPATVNARYATGLSTGMSVLVADDIVIAAWKKDAKAPSMIVGVTVK